MATTATLTLDTLLKINNLMLLQGEIKEAMDITTYEFANLYSWYSWPNVILPVLGGYLMDSVFGIRLGTVIFAGFIIIGQIMFSMGAFTEMFSLMEVRMGQPRCCLSLLPPKMCYYCLDWPICLWHRWRVLVCRSKHLCRILVQRKRAQHGLWLSGLMLKRKPSIHIQLCLFSAECGQIRIDRQLLGGGSTL